MHVHIIRHGQTAWNVDGRAQGHTDIELDATGRNQADLLGRSFEGKHVERLISSDLGRSLETARPIAAATGLEIEIRPDLRERSFGSWEGKQFTKFIHEMTAEQRENYADTVNFRAPNGESFQDVWHRLDRIYRDLETESRNTVIVSHGGTGCLLIAKLIEATPLSARAFRFANTGITTLHRRVDGQYYIERYNDTSHLRETNASA